MKTTPEIWNQKMNRLDEIAPTMSRDKFLGKEIDPILEAEVKELREFLDSHVDPEVDKIHLTGNMFLDLEKFARLGDDLYRIHKEMSELGNDTYDEDGKYNRFIGRRIDELDEKYSNLRMMQMNYQEKFLMTYDTSHKFYGK